jgi:hypothetical protein
MKGIVFTEFLEMVEDGFSLQTADRIIGRAALPHGGVYTSVGTYPHAEMARLVGALSEDTGLTVGHLLRVFGEHLAGRFHSRFPQFFAASPTLFDFLASIDSVIHVEVRKLYHDAELPSFVVEQRDARTMTLLYRSSRHLEDLAEGLMRGCAAHYSEPVEIERAAVAGAEAATRFKITRRIA